MNDKSRWSSARTVDEVKSAYEGLLAVLAASITKDYLSRDGFGNRIALGPAYGPSFETEPDEGSWVECQEGVFSLLYTERGLRRIILRNATADDVLFAVFKSITQTLATTFEAGNRVAGEDSRRQWFRIQERLMEQLNPAWADRLRATRL